MNTVFQVLLFSATAIALTGGMSLIIHALLPPSADRTIQEKVDESNFI